MLRTTIISAHEEEYTVDKRTLGILMNQDYDESATPFKDSFAYIYKKEKRMYIFFNTMVELFEYMFHGNDDNTIKCAYMSEDEFDKLYDLEYIRGSFNDKLTWTT